MKSDVSITTENFRNLSSDVVKTYVKELGITFGTFVCISFPSRFIKNSFPFKVSSLSMLVFSKQFRIVKKVERQIKKEYGYPPIRKYIKLSRK